MKSYKQHIETALVFWMGIGLLLAALAACVSKPDAPLYAPATVIADPGERAYADARQAYRQGDLDGALDLFSDYLAHHPKGRHAHEALFYLADVFAQKEQNEIALAFFERLVMEFPDSPHADPARLAMIDLLMKTGRMEAAHALAEALLQETVAVELRVALWQRLYRFFFEKGEYAKSGHYAYRLHQALSGSDRDLWEDRFARNSALLSAEELETVWDLVDDPDMQSYLIFRRALLLAIQEQYDSALEVLTLFQQRYPDHAYAAEASDLITTLSRRLTFEPFTLGCLLPLSGSYALYGQRALQGIELALSMLYRGETSVPIKVVIEDTASDEARAVQGVRALAEAGVAAIVGPIISAPAAAEEAQRLQIPMVTITQRADVTSIGNFIFRHFITPQNQVRTLVDYFINAIGLTEFAVMYPREAYGKTFLNHFWDAVIHQGGRVVAVEAYDTDQTDFADSIKRLVGAYYPVPSDLSLRPPMKREENPYLQGTAESGEDLEVLIPDPVARLTGLFYQTPDQDRARGPALGRTSEDDGIDAIIDFDVLFIPDAPKAAGLIIPQLAYYDITDVYLAGTNLWHSPQLIEMSRDYLQKAVMVDGFFKDGQSDPVRRFVDQYQQVYNQAPGIIEAFAFDTASLLFELLAQPQYRMRQHIRDGLVNALHAEGTTGPTAFDENGEPIKKLTLLKVAGGRFAEISKP